MTHRSVSSPVDASEAGAAQLEPGPSVPPEDLHLGEGEAPKAGRQRLSQQRDQCDRDPGSEERDQYGRGRVPPATVGSADSKAERAGNRSLDDDPDPSDEERDRAGREYRDHRGPRPLPSCQGRERNDRQALKGRTDEGHEPPQHLEDKRRGHRGRLPLRARRGAAHLATRARTGGVTHGPASPDGSEVDPLSTATSKDAGPRCRDGSPAVTSPITFRFAGPGGDRCAPGQLRSCYRPGWRNGRRGGLKSRCSKGRAGSSPAPGTPTPTQSRR